MTISYNWLKQYIDIPESAEEIGQVLTSGGLEVEKVIPHETIKGGLKGLVVGEVLTCSKHPNADKLSLTTVDVGNGTVLPIVCGAPNVAAGQKVIVALPGTTVFPTQGEPFTIKSAKIRGEKSEGMICAEDEIGLGQSHAGIIVLNTDTPNGTPAAQFYGVQSDYIIEIGLTPNRADAASHIGVARDVKASKGRKISWPDVDQFRVDNRDLVVPVEVIDVSACPRYSSVTIAGVKVTDSPEWLKQRLTAVGLAPINNVVDVTNFVCHELGQPLHAFDVDRIAGGKVIVRTLPAGTKFVTLDNKERTLTATDLMICNGKEEGMCIAGVFGGLGSGITSETKNVFLESAYFAADSVRRTSINHQLKTDASFRFERGVDPNNTVYALKRAALLIKEIAGGKISSDVQDFYPQPISNREIKVTDKHVDRLIGKQIPRTQVFEILQRLDIQIISETADSYVVSVAPYRVDVIQEADVIEEILRIYGFNNIELSKFARTDYLAEFPVKDIDRYRRSISEMLTGRGFYEIWTNSLTNQAYQTKHNLDFGAEPVEILNKLSEEQGILRQTLLFTGLEVCAYNINRKQRELKLFEFGKTYHKKEKYFEQEKLALYTTGNREPENWQRNAQAVSYHDLAQQVQHVFLKSGIKNASQEIIKDQLFEHGVRFMQGKEEIGKLGKVKSSLLKDFGIKQELFYAELDTALLFKYANPKLVIQEVTKFPEVRRDLSLVIDKKVSYDEIRKLIKQTEGKLITNVVAFDVYEGDKLPEGKKAYALAFTLQDESKTLTDEVIEKTMDRLMKALESQLGAIIRK
ncbi:phenylalanine--tRNA ligase subunit beta [Chryseolinea sp. T2]|uniref:phenylalanine--tRNA ligase subunit beta n=1 Tax=Chryseolinea sp. T2 TaxID=3129255 RepID=UPI00307871FF